jgi:hypothetical protein
MGIEDFTNKTIKQYYFTPDFVTFIFSTGTKRKVRKKHMSWLITEIIRSDADDDCIFRNKRIVEQIIKEMPPRV